MLHRRKFLISTISAGLLGIGGWLQLRRRDVVKTFGARYLAPTIPPALPTDQTFVSLIAIGDTGKATSLRREVLKQLSEKLSDAQVQFMTLLGDNFYHEGVTSVDDPQWNRDFEKPFGSLQPANPVYAILGNHDHFGNINAQVEYSKLNPQWKMPKTYYSFEKSCGDEATVEFFMLDTQPLCSQEPSQHQQLEWLRNKLAASKATWKIVAGHHPVISGGSHGGDGKLQELLSPLFDQYHVDLYMSGHDHDLQLHESQGEWLQLVSGSGAKTRSVNWIDSTIFAKAIEGFAWVLITPQTLSIEFVSVDGHCYTHDIKKSLEPMKSVRQEVVAL